MSAVPNRIEVREARERAVEVLTSSFASDLLALEEFEERIDLAHRATTTAELDKLIADVSRPEKALVKSKKGELSALPRDESYSLTVASAPSTETRNLVAIMGGVERKGAWRVPAKLRTIALMGGGELDLREAIFSPGVHELTVYAIMGGIEITVPPNLAIECDGGAIMGAFDSIHRAPVEPDPDRPLLRIRGLALMGGVEISTRLPRESKRDARKREKKTLKEAKKRRRKRRTSDH